MDKRSQLNIYVARDGRPVIDRLRRLSERTGTPVNTLVVEALAEYLARREEPVQGFGVFDLGVTTNAQRSQLYREHLDRKAHPE